MAAKKALLAIDFINEIIHPDGKLSGKGYAAFDGTHGVLDNAAKVLSDARARDDLIVHIKVGFTPSYADWPEGSPLFGAAKQYGALQLGTWATEFHEKVAPHNGEMVIAKHRVSAFFGTSLESLLRNQGVEALSIMGVATDLAVQAAARDAHDRDFAVTVLGAACGAASEEDHSTALNLLEKIAVVER